MNALYYFRTMVLVGLPVVLAGCNVPGNEAFLNRGEPTSLLETSTEKQTLDIGTVEGANTLARRLDQDRPTRAELNCAVGDSNCATAKKMLEREGVDVILGDTVDNTVILVYERVLAHECDHRFVYQARNYSHSYDPGFGCSVASNMVRAVSDKRQFVDPVASDLPNAKRGVDVVGHAYKPRPIVAPYSVGQSITSSSSQ